MSIAPTAGPESRTAYRICPLCEATCGLTLTVVDDRITRVRGDRDDVFSAGFICPKGAAFDRLDADPDRLRRPMVRSGDDWREVTWDEAFAVVAERLAAVVAEHGKQSVGLYLGNPNVHNIAGGLYPGGLARALGTSNVFSASSVDQMPKHVSSGLMFGDPNAIPIPDIDRTQFLLMLGANPVDSGGSLCTAPDFPGRLKALKARGGRLVVVDPRRTRTAALAEQHVAIRPSTDGLFLMAIVHVLLGEGLVDTGSLGEHFAGAERLAPLAEDFSPEAVAGACGIEADDIRSLARDLAAAETSVVYGRIGTSTVEFGTVTSWLVDVVNILTGNFDRPGGAMFPLPPHRRRSKGAGRGWSTGRWHSRVRRFPEVKGEMPAAVMTEEITTPGEGQIRAMITVAGNPVLSTPDGAALDEALAGLEFMVSVDPYLNETTRRADVILPPPPPTRSGHYDIAFTELSVRNVARYSPAVVALQEGELEEATILARLTLIAAGQQASTPASALDDGIVAKTLAKAVADPGSPVEGRDPAELAAALTGDTPTDRRLDMLLRLGAYGDGFGANPEGLSLARLLDAPHGIDLGPMQPRIPEVLRTTTGQVDVCPPTIAADIPRLREALDERRDGLVLIGRRHMRSNNSWMHNLKVLNSGSNTCTLQLHPKTAADLGLEDGQVARVASRTGQIDVPVEVTDVVMPGVASLPHGWGHTASGMRTEVASARPGVNTNLLTDPQALDPLSGNAVLNGIPVTVTAAN